MGKDALADVSRLSHARSGQVTRDAADRLGLGWPCARSVDSGLLETWC
jgi:hypothetical protein